MYQIVKFIALLIVRFLFPYKVINKERANFDGPALVVCNHRGNTDCFIVGSCFKKRVYYLCKKEWFKSKLIGGFLRFCGAIPVDRDNPDVEAVKTCLKRLKAGEKLVVFPEGTRNKTDERLLPVKGGAGMLAAKTGVEVLPMFIKERGRLFRRNYAYIGEKVNLAEGFPRRLSKEDEEKMGERIRDVILKTGDELDAYLEEKRSKKKRKG